MENSLVSWQSKSIGISRKVLKLFRPVRIDLWYFERLHQSGNKYKFENLTKTLVDAYFIVDQNQSKEQTRKELKS